MESWVIHISVHIQRGDIRLATLLRRKDLGIRSSSTVPTGPIALLNGPMSGLFNFPVEFWVLLYITLRVLFIVSKKWVDQFRRLTNYSSRFFVKQFYIFEQVGKEDGIIPYIL